MFQATWRTPCRSERLRDAAPDHRLTQFLAMLRNFRDKKGVEWLVWDVYPDPRNTQARESDPGVFPHPELADGWLCFESRSEKRRIAPVPANWHEWPAERLESLCDGAGYISRPGQRQSASFNAATPDTAGETNRPNPR